MYISQPAITKQIASLEKELGVRLFERSHSGITLTKSGEIMLDSFDRCSQDISQSLKIALKAGSSEHMSIGLLTGTDFRRAMECLRLFRLNHPDVSLHLYRAGSDELKEGILTGTSNAALLFDNHVENAAGFEYEPLFQSRLMYVIARGHPLEGREALTMRDIADYEFIFSNSGRADDQGTFGHISSAAQTLGIRREQVRFCRNFESIFTEVSMGQSMTLVDEYVSFLYDQFVTIPTGLEHNVVLAWKAGTGAPMLDRLLATLKRELS